MVVIEPVGTGLAIGGILLSFKGAVDGYLLLTSIFASDNGLRFASSTPYIGRGAVLKKTNRRLL